MVSIPSSLAVLIMRRAISPRLAISTDLSICWSTQWDSLIQQATPTRPENPQYRRNHSAPPYDGGNPPNDPNPTYSPPWLSLTQKCILFAGNRQHSGQASLLDATCLGKEARHHKRQEEIIRADHRAMGRKDPMPLQHPGLEAVCQTKVTWQRLLLAVRSSVSHQEVMQEIVKRPFPSLCVTV